MEHSNDKQLDMLAAEVLEAVNVGGMLHMPHYAVRNLVESFGLSRIETYLSEIREAGDRASQIKEGLRSCIACYSDEVAAAFFEVNQAITDRHLLRAIKLDPSVSDGLLDIMLGRASDEEVNSLAERVCTLTNVKSISENARSTQKVGKDVSEKTSNQNRQEVAVYAQSGALNFEVCASRRGDLALNVDAAISVGVRVYDWRKKIIVQLSEREMLMLYAVLRGFLKNFAVKAHGASNQKAMSIENQVSNFFVRVQERGRPIVAVPIPPSDAAMVLMLIGNAIVKNQPVLGSLEGVDGLVRPIIQMIEAGAQSQTA
jgi:hypothetical protein